MCCPVPESVTKKGPTRRQSQRPRPSRLLLTYPKSNETLDLSIDCRRSRAGHGRGSSLTLGVSAPMWRLSSSVSHERPDLGMRNSGKQSRESDGDYHESSFYRAEQTVLLRTCWLGWCNCGLEVSGASIAH